MIQQPDIKVLKNYIKVRVFALLIIADQMYRSLMMAFCLRRRSFIKPNCRDRSWTLTEGTGSGRGRQQTNKWNLAQTLLQHLNE